MTDEPVLTAIVNLDRLKPDGETLVLEADAETRARLAQWTDVESIAAFRAEATLHKAGTDRFTLAARFTADIVQKCVVTLAPIPAHIDERFTRALHLSRPVRGRAAAVLRADAVPPPAALLAEDEGPDEIGSAHYDWAGPVLEEFVLAIDPYPRAPGVSLETISGAPRSDPEAGNGGRENPFAVLKSLKTPSGT